MREDELRDLDYFKIIIQKVIDFREGYAKITDIIRAIGVDLLEGDIEDLKNYILDYEKQEEENRRKHYETI